MDYSYLTPIRPILPCTIAAGHLRIDHHNCGSTFFDLLTGLLYTSMSLNFPPVSVKIHNRVPIQILTGTCQMEMPS